MTDKYCLEKAIKYLGKMLKGQSLKTSLEIQEVKAIREKLNSMMYEVKK
jgi:hypothetical protein